MKKVLTAVGGWVKNNPYKVLQIVWMLSITLLLCDIRSDIAIKSRGRHISIGQRVSSIESDVSSIESDVSSMRREVSSIESDVSSIESDVSSIESDVSSIESDVSSINMRLRLR